MTTSTWRSDSQRRSTCEIGLTLRVGVTEHVRLDPDREVACMMSDGGDRRPLRGLQALRRLLGRRDVLGTITSLRPDCAC